LIIDKTYSSMKRLGIALPCHLHDVLRIDFYNLQSTVNNWAIHAVIGRHSIIAGL
jgi:hypothetical protein